MVNISIFRGQSSWITTKNQNRFDRNSLTKITSEVHQLHPICYRKRFLIFKIREILLVEVLYIDTDTKYKTKKHTLLWNQYITSISLIIYKNDFFNCVSISADLWYIVIRLIKFMELQSCIIHIYIHESTQFQICFL